jgi:hypothetical protein
LSGFFFFAGSFLAAFFAAFFASGAGAFRLLDVLNAFLPTSSWGTRVTASLITFSASR